MIEINAKIHDRYTLEFKVGYVADGHGPANEFRMDTWIFIPEVLDVNRHTYHKPNFYRDTRSMLRLITPPYGLGDLAKPSSLPVRRLRETCRDAEAGHGGHDAQAFAREIKMFSSIAKSSLRDGYVGIVASHDCDGLADKCLSYVGDIRSLLSIYRGAGEGLARMKPQPDCLKFYLFGDEFISNVVEQHVFRLAKFLKGKHPDVYNELRASLGSLADDEDAYRRRRGYICVETDSGDNNRQFVYHAGQLKKYIESNLYLPTRKRKNTVFLEQVAFSLAAGVSMIFATVVSFAFQQTYGNFTLPFFIALVISYMFKDRIKELIRYYFANRLGSRFYDYLLTIWVGNTRIGKCKEGFDFVRAEKLPHKVSETRARKSPLVINKGVNEQVMCCRKYVHLKRKELERLSPYQLLGINDIVRYNLKEFMRKMDNAQIPLFANKGGGGYEIVGGDKVYYLNFVIRCRYGKQSEYRRYRICLNRKGIKEIEER